MKKIFAPILLLVVMASCRNIKEPVFKSIEAVDMDKINLGNPSLKLNMKYFNPNKFSAKLKEAEGDAWIDSSFLGHFSVDSTITAPANSEFIVPVNLKVDMKYILQNSLSLFLKEQVTVRITGTAKAGKGGFYKNFPILYEGKQNVREMFH